MWDAESGELLNTLIHHVEAVLHLRFQNGMMVTCSKVSAAMFACLSLTCGYAQLQPFGSLPCVLDLYGFQKYVWYACMGKGEWGSEGPAARVGVGSSGTLVYPTLPKYGGSGRYAALY